ncbi:MAG: hypothetical protein QM479_13470 [Pseudomonadota bacterium]
MTNWIVSIKFQNNNDSLIKASGQSSINSKISKKINSTESPQASLDTNLVIKPDSEVSIVNKQSTGIDKSTEIPIETKLDSDRLKEVQTETTPGTDESEDVQNNEAVAEIDKLTEIAIETKSGTDRLKEVQIKTMLDTDIPEVVVDTYQTSNSHTQVKTDIINIDEQAHVQPIKSTSIENNTNSSTSRTSELLTNPAPKEQKMLLNKKENISRTENYASSLKINNSEQQSIDDLVSLLMNDKHLFNKDILAAKEAANEIEKKWAMARNYFSAKNYLKSEQEYLDLIKLEPEFTDFYGELSNLYFVQNEINKYNETLQIVARLYIKNKNIKMARHIIALIKKNSIDLAKQLERELSNKLMFKREF